MQDEHFEIRFLSNEQDFIYNFGVNRGHTLSFAKVNRCYFLSAEAKQLYHNICDYAWGSKRECRPSKTTLRTELGWGRHSMDKYLDELREAELVITERQGNMKPLIYKLNELHRCQKIIHSEIVHQIRLELGISGDEFLDALDLYRQTELCYADPAPGKEVIMEWFQEHLQEEQPEPEPSSVTTGRFSTTAPNPSAFPRSGEVTKVEDLDKKPKSKPTYDPSAKPENWNAQHFKRYFCDLFYAKYGKAYLDSYKDLGAFARVIRVNPEDTQSVKNKLDTYFKLDFFYPKGITNFCSQYVQSLLDQYEKTGMLPGQKKSSLALGLDTSDDDFSFENNRGDS